MHDDSAPRVHRDRDSLPERLPALPVALLFIAAMLCFFLGLLWFLREIYLATMNLRIGPR